MELPDEIWGLIKEYTFDWSIPHKKDGTYITKY